MDPTTRALIMGAAGASGDKIYVEDVFSTWLYTGTGATQTITNGIDLSGKGGLTWIKSRSGATGHRFTDTARGATKSLDSSSSAIEATESTGLTAFGSTGFTIGADIDYNSSGSAYTSWTFRKAPKFFDIVTYTGDGTTNRNIAHNLGAAPGSILVKARSGTNAFMVYHRSMPDGQALRLDSTGVGTFSSFGSNASQTSAVFQTGTVDIPWSNASGVDYVAYLFAHDAGGFGDSGNDSVIKCGSYTGNGSATGPIVNLGWEPQWVLIKNTSATGDWNLIDNMRGFVVGGTDSELNPNLSSGESTGTFVTPLPTGFQINTTDTGYNTSASGYIYIAIRRGPMKTPTDATKVFGLVSRTGTTGNATVSSSNLVTDAALIKNRFSSIADLFSSRLTGTGYLVTSTTAAEVAAATTILQANPWDVMSGIKVGSGSNITNATANTFINYLFSRAPGFFDVVAYTSSSSAPQTISHNLGVAPELIIAKLRNNGTYNWLGSNSIVSGKNFSFNSAAAFVTNNAYDSTATTFNTRSLWDTSAVITGEGLGAGSTFIVYLFASCPGVSKVGSYTGTGTTLQINCGFTAGARFVMIKRTDNTGDWYFWDTARGIVSGNDPYLFMNTSTSEVTTTDYIDPLSSGFEISSTAPAAINASGGTFIFLAIA